MIPGRKSKFYLFKCSPLYNMDCTSCEQWEWSSYYFSFFCVRCGGMCHMCCVYVCACKRERCASLGVCSINRMQIPWLTGKGRFISGTDTWAAFFIISPHICCVISFGGKGVQSLCKCDKVQKNKWMHWVMFTWIDEIQDHRFHSS